MNAPAHGLTGVLEAWRGGRAAAVDTALATWKVALVPGSADEREYWLQRVAVDAVFERPTLAVTAREAEYVARAAGDEVALARIGAHILDARYSDWLPSRDARPWLDILRGVSFPRLLSLPPATRLEIAAGLLAAELYGEALAVAADTAARVADWVAAAPDVLPAIRSNALGYAMEYFSGQRRWPPAHTLIARIDELVAQRTLPDIALAKVSSRRGFYYHYRRGDYADALAHSKGAIEAAERAAVARPAREAAITVTLCHLMRGDVAGADLALGEEAAAIPEGHLMLRANVAYERAWWHALRRDVVSAQRELDVACRLFAEVDEHGVMSFATPSLQAQLLLQVGEYDAALRVFELRLRRPDAWLVDMGFIQAAAALDRGDSAAASAVLREVLPVATRTDIKGVFWACRPELLGLLTLAIRENIEPEWAKSVCEARRLTAA